MKHDADEHDQLLFVVLLVEREQVSLHANGEKIENDGRRNKIVITFQLLIAPFRWAALLLNTRLITIKSRLSSAPIAYTP